MASMSDAPDPVGVLRERFDCVVMLTWSDWRREMRKNRYHYATRFARALPVLFVQPDLHVDEFRFEPTEVENLEILHLIIDYTSASQRRRFIEALRSRGFRRPLVWIYNFYLLDLVAHTWAPMKVYHATEDYFMRDAFNFTDAEMVGFHRVLEQVDLLVTVSQGVLDHYHECSSYRRRALVLANGCDFGFWRPTAADIAERGAGAGTGLAPDRRPVAFFQGLVMKKFDFDLLEATAARMPDWDFSLCGEVTGCHERFEALCRRPNVVFHGKLGWNDVRRLSLEADVGLIPYVQEPYITESSLPLKAFEYLATGLPVVTVPIRALDGRPDVFAFGRTAEEWEREIRRLGPRRWEATSLAERMAHARDQDYDRRFEALAEAVSTLEQWAEPPARPLRVLVAHDPGEAADLACLGRHSPDAVEFATVQAVAAGRVDLEPYDAVVLDGSVAAPSALAQAPAWLGYAGFRAAVARTPGAWPAAAWARPHLLLVPPTGSPAGDDVVRIPPGEWDAPASRAAWISARLRERIRSRVEETRWGIRRGAPSVLAPYLRPEDAPDPPRLADIPLGFPVDAAGAGISVGVDWDDLRGAVRRLFPPRDGLKALPLARALDDRVLKPFNRFWERHRRRLAGEDEPT